MNTRIPNVSHFNPVSVHGAVLAGGRSTRMGTDKALLEIEGKSLLLSTCERLGLALGLPVDQIWVSGNRPGFRSVSDLILDRGPLAGIHALVSILLEDGAAGHELLILPVDMPAVSPQLLQTLVVEFSLASQKNGGLDAAHFDLSPFPLLIRLSSSVKDSLEQVLHARSGSLAVRDWLSCLKVEQVTCSEQERMVLNVNTPTDWSRYAAAPFRNR